MNHCDTCKWWEEWGSVSSDRLPWGNCERPWVADLSRRATPGGMECRSDFGCVEWEAK